MSAHHTGPNRQKLCSHFGTVNQDEFGVVRCTYCGAVWVPIEYAKIEHMSDTRFQKTCYIHPEDNTDMKRRTLQAIYGEGIEFIETDVFGEGHTFNNRMKQIQLHRMGKYDLIRPWSNDVKEAEILKSLDDGTFKYYSQKYREAEL